MTLAQRSQIVGYRRPRSLLPLALALLLLAVVLALSLAAHAGAPPGLRALEAMAEGYYGLPSGLLARVRQYEGDRDHVALRRGRLICGRYQIAALASGWRLCRLARGPAGTWIAAQLLDESRARYERECREVLAAGRTNKRCRCRWQHWNHGDRSALCTALAALGGET